MQHKIRDKEKHSFLRNKFHIQVLVIVFPLYPLIEIWEWQSELTLGVLQDQKGPDTKQERQEAMVHSWEN